MSLSWYACLVSALGSIKLGYPLVMNLTNSRLSVELPYLLVHSECISVLSIQGEKQQRKSLEITINLINRRWGEIQAINYIQNLPIYK